MTVDTTKHLPALSNELKVRLAEKLSAIGVVDNTRWRKRVGIRSAAVFSLVLVVLAFLNATVSATNWFDETGISNGVGECHYLEGDYIVLIDGTFDGATVTLQTAVRNTQGSTPCASADRMIDVSVPGLVGVVIETEFIGIVGGAGFYRLLVVGGGGSELINGHFRKAK